MIRVVILALLVLFAYLYFERWKKSDPGERKRLVWKTILGAFAGLLVFLVVTGRIHILTAAVAALFPLLKRVPALLRYLPVLGNLMGQARGEHLSRVRSHLLALTLDHRTGRVSGEVIAGQFARQPLDSLSPDQIRALFDEALHTSPDSLPLLEAYCVSRFGADWRQQFGVGAKAEGATNGMGPLSVDDALRILGLSKNPDKQEIIAAHRRLIQRFHPDRGGTDYLAHLINEAKSVLLKSIGED